MKHVISVIALSIFVSCAHLQGRASKQEWQVIAHRGASAYLPEHTLEAVAMAAGWGVDFVEPDVVLTRDNVPVVLHDIHLENSTDVAQKFPFRKRKDGRYYVRDFRLREIQTLNVLERSKEHDPTKAVFPNRFPRTLNRNSFRVPSLEEYLEFVEGLRQTTGHKLGVCPEIKSSAFHLKEGQDIVKIVYETVMRFGYEKTPELIYLQSFDPADLKRLKSEMKTKIPLVQLVGKNSWGESAADYEKMLSPEGLKEVANYAQVFSPSLDQLFTSIPGSKQQRADLVSGWAHAAGLKVIPYTHRREQLPEGFDSIETFFKVLKNDSKIDGIFSDSADDVLIWQGRLKQ